MAVPTEFDRRVRKRAKQLCEFCHLPQAVYPWTFEIDHIVAEQHRGKTQMSNLALACTRCNRSKGPNLSGLDTQTRQITPLFHPRRDQWADHFRWRGPRLVGLTPVGRVTIHVLNMNDAEDIKIRRMLIAEGAFPPVS